MGLLDHLFRELDPVVNGLWKRSVTTPCHINNVLARYSKQYTVTISRHTV